MPPVLMSEFKYRHFHDDSLVLAFSIHICRATWTRLFPRRSRQQSSANAARGRFEAGPCRQTSEGRFLHHFHSFSFAMNDIHGVPRAMLRHTQPVLDS